MRLPRLYQHKHAIVIFIGLPVTAIGAPLILVAGLVGLPAVVSALLQWSADGLGFALFVAFMAVAGGVGLTAFWQWAEKDLESLSARQLRHLAWRLSAGLLTTPAFLFIAGGGALAGTFPLLLFVWFLLTALAGVWLTVEVYMLAHRAGHLERQSTPALVR